MRVESGRRPVQRTQVRAADRMGTHRAWRKGIEKFDVMIDGDSVYKDDLTYRILIKEAVERGYTFTPLAAYPRIERDPAKFRIGTKYRHPGTTCEWIVGEIREDFLITTAGGTGPGPNLLPPPAPDESPVGVAKIAEGWSKHPAGQGWELSEEERKRFLGIKDFVVPMPESKPVDPIGARQVDSVMATSMEPYNDQFAIAEAKRHEEIKRGFYRALGKSGTYEPSSSGFGGMSCSMRWKR